MSDDPEWFAPKRYGYGSGLPVAWQGWAVLTGYIALLGLAGFLLPHSVGGYISTVIGVTALLCIICARTTKGGWRWRWGGDE